MTRLPTACYRLQFRDGMNFDRAAAIVPYLASLGISDLYASPLFTATEGSTHGYDVTDPGEIDPALGGREGLARLSSALRQAGMGLVLDIVPNHMAFTVETPWLRDVLRHGAKSRYARHFDLAMEKERLRLPWLGASFEEQLDAGAFSVEDGEEGPELVVEGALRVPLSETGGLEAARSGDRDAIRALHAAQPWRLVSWRTERDALTHRRFFNVTSLIGMRVEDEAVFEDIHRLLFELVEEGTVTGVRIDHIDGLADPKQYLDRLSARLGDVPIWVEKILTGSEAIQPSWPIQGTTGYVAARAFNRLLTSGEGLERIDAAYRQSTGRTDGFDLVMYRASRQIMTQDLAAELWTLHAMVADLAQHDPVACEYGPETLRQAIIDLIAAFPRYRSYMTAATVSEEDARLIRGAAEEAASGMADPGALPFLAEILTRATPETAPLRIRFQQVTGAAIAKSQEDTAFYREIRLLSLNEVGGEPDDEPLGARGFHRRMQRRAETMPHGLTLTSSHDTKRSEDARARIAAITWAPDAFLAFHALCREVPDDGISENFRWYIAQTILAIDPEDGNVAERLETHVEKALREAKRNTFWTAPNPEVEDPAKAYALRLAERFAEVPDELAPLRLMGDRLSLIQTGLKLTVPGIPDIYQGCEVANYSLTDPDNRRAVDFDALARALDDPGSLPKGLDRQKFLLTRRLLSLRAERPALFLSGDYVAREAEEEICAFARTHGDVTLTVALAADPEIARRLPALEQGEAIWPDPYAPADAPLRVWLSA